MTGSYSSHKLEGGFGKEGFDLRFTGEKQPPFQTATCFENAISRFTENWIITMIKK
jgi:hypothetical protein